jgi:hypothetical protein|tara:strand:+ start:145 stop:564 length:420 start_codon:yes stop_codon:yes gene_type:complete
MKTKMLIFHAAAVDSNSVTSADDGANLDLAAFDPANITSIAAENNGAGLVYVYFANSNRFEGGPVGSATELLEQAFVRLTCTSGREIDVVKDLTALACNTASYENPVVVFDAINSVYPINHITGIQIRRHATTVTVTSD